jgi:predicted ArsR family transcriptional regulator
VVTVDGLTSAKRRIVDALKRGPATVPELAARFELTTEAVRQHLADLAGSGLVSSAPSTGRRDDGTTTGRRAGRPPIEWALTDLAVDLFPNRHADLTVSLIRSIRAAVGEEGLDRVIARRTEEQLDHYRSRLEGLPDPVAELARLRSDEGYMAEVVDAPDGDGRLLVEHHCPICDAAAACQGLCRSELEVFRSALGPRHEVDREQHLLSGDERCVYRIRPVGERRSSGSAPAP